MWQDLSAEERRPYEDLAEKDKERYARETARYLKVQFQQVAEEQIVSTEVEAEKLAEAESNADLALASRRVKEVLKSNGLYKRK